MQVVRLGMVLRIMRRRKAKDVVKNMAKRKENAAPAPGGEAAKGRNENIGKAQDIQAVQEILHHIAEIRRRNRIAFGISGFGNQILEEQMVQAKEMVEGWLKDLKGKGD